MSDQFPESKVENVEATGWDGFPVNPAEGGTYKLAYNGKQSLWEWHPGSSNSVGYWTEGTITCWPHEMYQYRNQGKA